MNNAFKGGTAALYSNLRIPEKRETALRVAKLLRDCGLSVRIPDTFYHEDDGSFERLGAVRAPKESLFDGASLAVVVGGDGTVLETARYTAGTGVPILAVNMGRVGYMTEIEPDELELIKAILDGQGRIEKRSTLCLKVNGEFPSDSTALNDIVVSNSVISQVIDISVSESGQTAGRYRADGIIFSTATGSTAYNVAAGGPVVDPRLRCIAVTPVCPHTYYSKPTVFPPDAMLDVSLAGFRGRAAHIYVDGRLAAKAGRNDRIEVTTSDKTVDFIRIKPAKFYQTLHRKNEL